MNIYAVNLQIFYEYKALYAKKIVFKILSKYLFYLNYLLLHYVYSYQQVEHIIKECS